MKFLRLGLILLICIFSVCFIFWNSFQNGETSNAFSGWIAELLQPFLDAHNTDARFHEHIRKLAHFIEFCILGCAVGGLMHWLRSLRGRYHIAMSLFILLAIAVIDEYIQSFTGRTSLVKDILIDFGGGLTGLILVSIPVFLRKLWMSIRMQRR